MIASLFPIIPHVNSSDPQQRMQVLPISRLPFLQGVQQQVQDVLANAPNSLANIQEYADGAKDSPLKIHTPERSGGDVITATA